VIVILNCPACPPPDPASRAERGEVNIFKFTGASCLKEICDRKSETRGKKDRKKMDERSAFLVLKVVNTHTVSPPSIHSFPPHSSPTATRSLKVLPAVKAGYFLALICSSAPVLGLRPTRAARSLRSKMPKPGGGDREGGGREVCACACVAWREAAGGERAAGARSARAAKKRVERLKKTRLLVSSPLLPSCPLSLSHLRLKSQPTHRAQKF